VGVGIRLRDAHACKTALVVWRLGRCQFGNIVATQLIVIMLIDNAVRLLLSSAALASSHNPGVTADAVEDATTDVTLAPPKLPRSGYLT
jgi:hypothetical protein